MSAPLARDQSGQPFELPPNAVYWRVRRHTGGRPSSVLGADGEPLHVPIGADYGELAASGCSAAGSYRLEAVDEQRKPVGAPTAFVELMIPASSESRPLPSSSNDLAAVTRMADALARVTESNNKQEGVIALAREMAHAMTSMQQTQAAIMVALVQGKYPSPAAFAPSSGGIKEQIQQWLEVQKLMRKDEDAQRRNVGALDASPVDDTSDDTSNNMMTMLVNALAPHLGQLANAGVTRLLGAAPDQSLAGAQPAAAAGLPVDAIRNGTETRSFKAIPKVLREVWAQLDDDEAQEFADIIDANSDERLTIFAGHVASCSPADRLSFVRKTMREANGEPAAAPEHSIPDAFKPLFAQLSTDEQQTAARMVSRLNGDAIRDLGVALLKLAPSAQLAKVRQMIATFDQRESSSAQRAVFSVLRGNDNDNEGGQAA